MHSYVRSCYALSPVIKFFEELGLDKRLHYTGLLCFAKIVSEMYCYNFN